MNKLDKIDLNQLRVLVTLLETRSVTRAALRLGISQPSASRALETLRKAFGDPLLVKTNAGMTPTQRAEALREPLYQWLSATHNILRSQDADDGAGIAGHVRVASTDYGVLSVIEPALPDILRQAPGLHVDICPLSPENLNQLSGGAVDVAVSGWDPEPCRVHERLLFQDSYCCIFRQGHRLAAVGLDAPLTIDELLDWPHVMLSIHAMDIDPLAPHLRTSARPRRVTARLPYLVSALLLLQKTDAILVAPVRALRRLSADLQLATRPTPVELGTFDYWLYWHERSRRDPVVAWFIETLARAASEANGA
ncbi:LysR family transcriptional regulator [Thauera linaloolentis]|uniref:LysR family transcriptional regulator n=1 Tax=Thauera linaloolentis (strain DSM 12138 / JCM 21573 / CCUG 41526 / CIP 105981 / IAM 15112 / NBRC 102519 / 47Lol) TaxID=1123367 RepID=N6YX59_THAL4|nr:LysR family transcriptional regulator [Thauera linaloolentis]ENO86982.1 LysR family transcriptional regulator [Thauera linaloolentis 47Lol = DSM 12138]MCM8564442.1 LysR family transcriptional regulator [Thauera linaloolentis]